MNQMASRGCYGVGAASLPSRSSCCYGGTLLAVDVPSAASRQPDATLTRALAADFSLAPTDSQLDPVQHRRRASRPDRQGRSPSSRPIRDLHCLETLQPIPSRQLRPQAQLPQRPGPTPSPPEQTAEAPSGQEGEALPPAVPRRCSMSLLQSRLRLRVGLRKGAALSLQLLVGRHRRRRRSSGAGAVAEPGRGVDPGPGPGPGQRPDVRPGLGRTPVALAAAGLALMCSLQATEVCCSEHRSGSGFWIEATRQMSLGTGSAAYASGAVEGIACVALGEAVVAEAAAAEDPRPAGCTAVGAATAAAAAAPAARQCKETQNGQARTMPGNARPPAAARHLDGNILPHTAPPCDSDRAANPVSPVAKSLPVVPIVSDSSRKATTSSARDAVSGTAAVDSAALDMSDFLPVATKPASLMQPPLPTGAVDRRSVFPWRTKFLARGGSGTRNKADPQEAAARHLTYAITTSRDWRQLQDLVQSYHGTLNAMHVTALLGKLARQLPPPAAPAAAVGASAVMSFSAPAPLAAVAQQPGRLHYKACHPGGERLLVKAPGMFAGAAKPAGGAQDPADDAAQLQAFVMHTEGAFRHHLAAALRAVRSDPSSSAGARNMLGSVAHGSSFALHNRAVHTPTNIPSAAATAASASTGTTDASYHLAAPTGAQSGRPEAHQPGSPGQHPPLLGPRQLATSLSALARLRVAGWGVAEDPGLRETALTLAAAWGFGAFKTQELVTLLHAVAKLGLRPSPAWLQAATATAASAAHLMFPRELSTLLWALATLQYRPDRHSMNTWLAASLHAMPYCSAYDVSQALWALAKLLGPRPPPPPPLPSPPPSSQAVTSAPGAAVATTTSPPVLPARWVAAALRRTGAVLRPGVCAPQDVCNSLWAVARLGLAPPLPWVRGVAGALLAAPDATLARCGPADLAGLLWALATLKEGSKPPLRHMQRLLAALQGLAGQCGEQDVANVLWALGSLRFRPHLGLMRALGGRLVQLAAQGGAGPQLLATALWCCVRLRLPPGPGLLRPLLAACGRRASDFGPHSSALLLYSLARLRHLGWLPDELWTAELEPRHQEQQREEQEAGPLGVTAAAEGTALKQPLSNTVTHVPPVAAAAVTGRQLQQQPHKQQPHHHYRPSQLEQEVRQQLNPPGQTALCVRPIMDAAFRGVVSEVDPEAGAWPRLPLPMLLWAVARLGLRPDPVWMRRVLVHTVEVLRGLDVSEAAQVASALVWLRFQPPPLWLDRLEHLLRTHWEPQQEAEALAAAEAERDVAAAAAAVTELQRHREQCELEAQRRHQQQRPGGQGDGQLERQQVQQPSYQGQGRPQPPPPQQRRRAWDRRERPGQGLHWEQPQLPQPQQREEADDDWVLADLLVELQRLRAVARWRAARHDHMVTCTARLARRLRVLRRWQLHASGRNGSGRAGERSARARSGRGTARDTRGNGAGTAAADPAAVDGTGGGNPDWSTEMIAFVGGGGSRCGDGEYDLRAKFTGGTWRAGVVAAGEDRPRSGGL